MRRGYCRDARAEQRREAYRKGRMEGGTSGRLWEQQAGCWQSPYSSLCEAQQQPAAHQLCCGKMLSSAEQGGGKKGKDVWKVKKNLLV